MDRMDSIFDESIEVEKEKDLDQDQEDGRIPIHDGNASETPEGERPDPDEDETASASDEVRGEEEDSAGKQEKVSGQPDKEEKEEKGKKKKSIGALEIELKKSKEKMEDYADRYQRLLAEFENARARNAREQSHMYDVGAKDILSKLLPVVDNFERGIDALSEEEKERPFAQGFIKIYQQLMTSLDEAGVKPMNATGKEFDPNFHNAVMHEDNEEMGENLVAEEFQKGYMYKEEVLRPSMVKVVN